MSIYLVPCGISVLDNLALLRGAPRDDLPVVEALDELMAWAAAQVEVGPPLLRAWHRDCADTVAGIRLPEWNGQVSAELSTLAKQTGIDRPRVTDRDSIVLLASQTTKGLLAGLLTATYLTGGAGERIRHSATHPRGLAGPSAPGRGSPDYGLSRGHVCLVTVNGLRPREGDGFRAAAGGIGDVMRAVRDHAGTEPIEVHLTGGFKAILMHTLALAEILKSTAQDRASVTAWYLADGEEDWWVTEADEIGLRCFNPDTLGVLRNELADVAGRRPVQSDEYRGVAWEMGYGDTPILNAFGHGYRAMLGDPGAVTDEGEDVHR